MLGTLAAISTINHASAQESSNTGNATDFASNPEKQPCVTCADPLQEMVPAMTITPREILKCPATPLSEPVVVCTTINHASAQESSNTGNATDFASNPEKQPCGTCIPRDSSDLYCAKVMAHYAGDSEHMPAQSEASLSYPQPQAPNH